MKQPGLHVVHAAAVRDAAGVNARPGSVLVKDARVVAIGDPRSFDPDLLARAQVIDKRDSLLLPAVVNAHTHLELTGIGPQPYDPAGGFVGWVKMLRERNNRDTIQRRDSVQAGVVLSTTSGVQAVGDIASDPGIAVTHNNRLLQGRTYLELFGLGPPFDEHALSALADATTGLQPHAPYSAGPTLYENAAHSGRPVSTHLAETLDEVAFIKSMTGPHLAYLKSIGKWDDAFARHYGQGLSPVQWMRPHLEHAADAGGWLVAHCNYVDDDDIKLLADTNTSVAYCPIASEYFGHKDHRYRDMLAAGVNVCLGTDSIVCANPDDPQPLGLISAMRRLYQRDQTNPDTLLAMATVNGAKALRLDQSFATLQQGAQAKFACIRIDADSPADPLEKALNGQAPVEALSFDVSDSA